MLLTNTAQVRKLNTTEHTNVCSPFKIDIGIIRDFWNLDSVSLHTIFNKQTFDILSPLSGKRYGKWKQPFEVLPNQMKNDRSSYVNMCN
jgi:hypothetical protein